MPSQSNKGPKTTTPRTPQDQPGYVYIIESPSPQNLLEGLGEGRLIQEALSLFGIHSQYKLAVDYDCFEKAIGHDLTLMLRSTPVNPIVHISAHGQQPTPDSGGFCDGISLTDGYPIDWDDLRTHLSPINKLLNNELIVCMSSCYGFEGLRAAFTRFKTLPFYALIGNTESCYWHESGIAYATFYHHFFRKRASLENAVKKMRAASGNKEFNLIYAKNARALYISLLRYARDKEREHASGGETA